MAAFHRTLRDFDTTPRGRWKRAICAAMAVVRLRRAGLEARERRADAVASAPGVCHWIHSPWAKTKEAMTSLVLQVSHIANWRGGAYPSTGAGR